MTLDECRKSIDQIDKQIRELMMERMNYSKCVAEAKQESGDLNVYRADREVQILERLGETVPADRRAPYLAVVRKITETSRMYQYGFLYEWNEGIFNTLKGSELVTKPGTTVEVSLTRPNCPNAMSSILAMVGDYGYNMSRMSLVEETAEYVTFDLIILGDATEEYMRKMLFQLSKESERFEILAIQ